ncbi:MAG: hypothetical protein R3A44_21435 [Caldilineaceae bacterium]
MNPIHSSFAKTSALIKITFTIPEYLAAVEQDFRSSVEQLPMYALARCPICNSVYQGRIDTHSLLTWKRFHPEVRNSIYRDTYELPRCNHFVAAQPFLNLNGFLPSETSYISNGNGDIPIVSPELLLDETNSYAVMHCLPICRIEEQQFVPRYSLYIITYYADEPEQVRARAREILFPPGSKVHWGTILDSCDRLHWEPQVADLQYWVNKEKLFWLDLVDQSLPLIGRQSVNFPYSGIYGFGRAFIFRKHPKPKWFWQQKEWSPQGEIRDWSELHQLEYPSTRSLGTA